MGRKKVGNQQFNCRINPRVLKEARRAAAARDERLGEVIEAALIKYLKITVEK